MNGTVKQFLDALEEMREIYPFDDEKTRIVTHDINITVDYHENDRPNREKKKRVFWVVNGGKEKQV